MSQGRKDLMPGEIEPELLARLMRPSKRPKFVAGPKGNRKAGKGREGMGILEGNGKGHKAAPRINSENPFES